MKIHISTFFNFKNRFEKQLNANAETKQNIYISVYGTEFLEIRNLRNVHVYKLGMFGSKWRTWMAKITQSQKRSKKWTKKKSLT